MALKLNISDKGKAWKLDFEDEALFGRNLGDVVNGKEISADLEGYELEITGATDLAGFPHKKEVEGQALKKLLMTRGWGMHDTRKGIRLRKTVRGKQLSEKTKQVNFIIKKSGAKNLPEIFPDQNKAPEPPAEEKPAEVKTQEAPQVQSQETQTSETLKAQTQETQTPEAPKENAQSA